MDLPIAGLRVELDLPADAAWSVRSRWDPEHPEDVLTLTSPAGEASYGFELAGRTARDCPLDDAFPVEIGGEPWISGRDALGERLCRILPDARALVRVIGASAASGLEAHAPVLAALLDAMRKRRLVPADAPRPEVHAGAELALTTAGIALDAPADGMEWRVARPSAERQYDALVRVVPVFPEVQIAVRRHALAEVPGCARLVRHLLQGSWSASGAPPPGWQGGLGRWVAGFRALALCREKHGALLDVRVAANPPIDLAAVMPMLDALASARELHAPPPSAVVGAPVRTTLTRTTLIGLGLDFPGTVDANVPSRIASVSPFATLELGLAWVSRNGPALAASVSLGADAHGALLGATIEGGIAFALDDELSFVFALAFEDRSEALYANRSLSAVFDMRSGYHHPGDFAWSLRVMPLQLASREPAITALPLAISWQGLFASGFCVGVELRWVTTPTSPSAAWPSEGLAVGVRFGVGDVRR